MPWSNGGYGVGYSAFHAPLPPIDSTALIRSVSSRDSKKSLSSREAK